MNGLVMIEDSSYEEGAKGGDDVVVNVNDDNNNNNSTNENDDEFVPDACVHLNVESKTNYGGLNDEEKEEIKNEKLESEIPPGNNDNTTKNIMSKEEEERVVSSVEISSLTTKRKNNWKEKDDDNDYYDDDDDDNKERKNLSIVSLATRKEEACSSLLKIAPLSASAAAETAKNNNSNENNLAVVVHEQHHQYHLKNRSHQWVVDRVNGQSKIGKYHPPCRMCTVPPCVKWCPRILEQNCLCETLGRIGIKPNPKHKNKHRRYLMIMGLLSNVIGAILTTVSCFATSTNNFNFIRNTAFTDGDIKSTVLPSNHSQELFGVESNITTNTIIVDATSSNSTMPIALMNVDIGLRAVAFDNPRTVGKAVLSFDDLCSLKEGVVVRQQSPNLAKSLQDETCWECALVSTGLTASMYFSLFTYIPSISTNILRMYENYDVNCQKSFGMGTTLFSFFMSGHTWLGYKNSCFGSLYKGIVFFDRFGNAVTHHNTNAVMVADFMWKPGPGYICIVVATLLKTIDFICHVMIRTPKITRNRKEQFEYEERN